MSPITQQKSIIISINTTHYHKTYTHIHTHNQTPDNTHKHTVKIKKRKVKKRGHTSEELLMSSRRKISLLL